jgi:arylformamidase
MTNHLYLYQEDVMLKGYRIIELSHTLYPGSEEYQLEVQNHFVDELLPDYERPPETWYIMSEVQMWSHVGTHMETPFHYFKDGQDCALIPLERVVGEGVLLDFTDKTFYEAITVKNLEERGQNIQAGDIVFIRTGLSHFYRTSRSHDRPYFPVESIHWLVNRKIACLGVDCSGIEKRGESIHPAHEALLKAGIPLIEHLAHLDQLRRERFWVVAVPWRVHGLDASPVSVIAFEPQEE